MTRHLTAGLALAFIAAVVALDAKGAPPNPYQAPAALAFESGLPTSGGFCGAMPR